MSITIYPSEPCIVPVKFDSNPLSPYSKEYSDIENVLICLKDDPSQPDDSILIKYYKDEAGSITGDILIDEQENTFSIVKGEDDQVPVSLGGFRVFIGVKVSGFSKFLWLRVDKDQKIYVEEDGIKS